MRRPCHLHIVPEEFYKTERSVSSSFSVLQITNFSLPASLPLSLLILLQVNISPHSPVVVVPDMSFLANCVYREYQSRVHALHTSSQSLAPPPPPCSLTEGEVMEEEQHQEEESEEEEEGGAAKEGEAGRQEEEEAHHGEDKNAFQNGDTGMEVVEPALPPSPPPSPPTGTGPMEQ